MKMLEVTNRKLEKLFLEIHVEINKSHPAFIRPLDRDIRAIFDPKTNKAFRHGEAVRWILLNDKGLAMGRIAAFTNRKYKNKGDEVRIGGIGFFDCIDEVRYSELLFDTAQKWLKDRGMQGMDGPINFGERDRWWGLLVDGFEPPLYGMNFNPPYYEMMFENYGFRNFYNQICWHIPFTKQAQLSSKFYKAHERIAADPAFHAKSFKKHEDDKFAHDFSIFFNKAWAKHEGNRAMSTRQVKHFFNSMKPIMDEDLVWIAYHGKDPIAAWISIPDINMAIKGLKGKLGYLGKIRFWLNKVTGKMNRFVGIIFGVVPMFQGKGIDYYLIVEAEKQIKKRGRYDELELQWQGDFNPKMLNISRNLGAQQKRRLVTYRYLFDRSAPFHRHPMLA